MTAKDFCFEVKRKIGTLAGKCDTKLVTERKLVALAEEDTLCEERLANVEVVADKVPACLAAMETWWDAGVVHLQTKAVCREAMVGKTAIGASCFFDLECPQGSYCVAKVGSDDPLDNVCSPVLVEGSPCREGVGATCGPELTCVAEKCAARPKEGDACKPNAQVCAPGLTCLLANAAEKEGKCGPRRLAGEACHRWTECHGACVTPSEAVRDGTCASFCGSK